MRTRKKRINYFKLLFVLLLVFFGIALAMKEYKIYEIQKEEERTNARIEALQQEQAELEAERKRLADPQYIEKLAREEHNMIGKDEVPLFIIKEEDKDTEKK